MTLKESLIAAARSKSLPARVAKKIMRRPANALMRGFLSMGYNQVTVDGYDFRIPRSTSFNLYGALITGSYEWHERKLLQENFETADEIVELGSNIGIVAGVAVNLNLNPNGHITCFEPNRELIETLSSNIRRQTERPENSSKTFSVEQAAIDSKGVREEAAFLVRGLGSGLTDNVLHTGVEDQYDVPVRKLSDVVRGKKRYSLICDIEGGEIDLIFQDAAALDNCNQIMIELHGPEKTGRSETKGMMMAELRNLGFHPRAHSGDCRVLAR